MKKRSYIKLHPLPDIAKHATWLLQQNQNLHFVQSSTHSLTTSSIHKKTNETFTYELSWTTSSPVYREKLTVNFKNKIFAALTFKEKFNRLPPKPNKTELSFRKLPTKTMHAFSH